MLTRFLNIISRPGSLGAGVPIVSGAFTPEPSALLLARAAMQSSGSPSPGVDIGTGFDISDSAGLTWTLAGHSSSDWPWNVGNRIWWAIAPLVPVPIVITITPQAFPPWGGQVDLFLTAIDVLSYTGYDADAPIGTSETFQDPVTGYAATWGPWSVALVQPPVLTSELLVFLSGDTDNPDTSVPGPAYTLVVDNVGYNGMFAVEARPAGSMSGVVDWLYRLYPGHDTGQSNMAVVEVRAASSPPAGPSPSVLMPLYVGGL